MEQLGQRPLNVLVIAKYEPTFDWTQLSLQEQHYHLVGRVDSTEQALKTLTQTPVDIILADSSGDGVLDLAWFQQPALRSTETLILVIATTSEMEFVREAMLAGAKGFLLKPFDLAELSRSIQQVHQLWLQSHALMAEAKDQATAGPTQKAHSIAVFSPKGGTGATTLAVNLAIALKQESGSPVLLVDADIHTPDIDIFLSIFSKHSILDLMDLDHGVDSELLQSVTTEHATDVTILRGDSRLQFLDMPFDPGQMGDLVNDLISLWDGYIVINTNNGLDRMTAEILDIVDTVLLVTTPQLPAIRAMRNFLDLAEATEDQSGKWHVVMTSYQGNKTLKTSDIEASIQHPIKATIAEDSVLVSTSINRGIPLLTSHRKSPVAKDVLALAKQLVEAQSKSHQSQISDGERPSSEEEIVHQQAQSGKRFSFWGLFTGAERMTTKPNN